MGASAGKFGGSSWVLGVNSMFLWSSYWSLMEYSPTLLKGSYPIHTIGHNSRYHSPSMP